MNTLTLIPAYGRDYETEAEVLADWNAGKDFRIMDISSRWDGSYTSRRDTGAMLAEGRTAVKLRYKRLEEVAVIALEPLDA